MTHEQRDRRNASLLAATGLIMSLAATVALAVRLHGGPAAPGSPQPHTTAAVQAVQGARGPFIDHSAVEGLEQDLQTDTSGMSIAAYGS